MVDFFNRVANIASFVFSGSAGLEVNMTIFENWLKSSGIASELYFLGEDDIHHDNSENLGNNLKLLIKVQTLLETFDVDLIFDSRGLYGRTTIATYVLKDRFCIQKGLSFNAISFARPKEIMSGYVYTSLIASNQDTEPRQTEVLEHLENFTPTKKEVLKFLRKHRLAVGASFYENLVEVF
jgi:hypothetical protein